MFGEGRDCQVPPGALHSALTIVMAVRGGAAIQPLPKYQGKSGTISPHVFPSSAPFFLLSLLNACINPVASLWFGV